MAEALTQRHHEALLAQEQLRALSHRIEAAREEEGTRISRELHDQLGQELTALKLDLARVKRLLQQTCPSSAAGTVGASLDQIGQQIDGCVDSVRRMAAELRPSVLDRLGLGPGLEWLAKSFEQRTNVPCACEGCDGPFTLSSAAATALFRVTQEALTNVARHARATAVHITLDPAGSDLVLTIQDDGVGLTAESEGASLGLLGMKERVHLVGGELTLQSAPGAGTRVQARVPQGVS
jgi:signal transduction histidine kinase